MCHLERGQSEEEKPVLTPAEGYCSVRHYSQQGLNANSSNILHIAIYLDVVSMIRGRTGYRWSQAVNKPQRIHSLKGRTLLLTCSCHCVLTGNGFAEEMTGNAHYYGDRGFLSKISWLTTAIQPPSPPTKKKKGTLFLYSVTYHN